MTTVAATRPVVPFSLMLGIGAALGVIYTLSPLTVFSVAGLILVTCWAGRGLSGREQQWFVGLLTVAIAARLAVIAGLLLFADPSQPYGSFFGDEELFKSRAMWLRNIGLGIPISKADFIYVYDETGKSSYLYILTYLQALVGDAPYGVHVMNAVLYVSGVLLLYRLVRPAFGRIAAFGALAVLLYLPSLFTWSISALKEPLYTLVVAVELACALQVVRAPRYWRKGLALAAVIAAALVLDGLRRGGLAVALAGAGLGLAAGLVVRRPHWLLVAAAAIPLAASLALTQPAVQQRLLQATRTAASYHAGHVRTPGYSYKLLPSEYYIDGSMIGRMPPAVAASFVIRSLGNYVMQPLPWQIESRTMLAYLPELMLWYVTVALVPFGVVAGLRRDAVLTCLLLSHALVVAAMVAVTSGNVGTLVRHRGLALPYLLWLSVLGGCEVMRWLATPSTATAGKATRDGYR